MDKFEQKFFKCFGIEPKTNRQYGYKMAIYNEAGTEEIKFYPQITDHILLDLICILNTRITAYDAEYRWCRDRKNLKLVILRDCIYNKELIQTQVVKLFKEV